MSDVVKGAWGRYLRALQKHPLRTKAITAAVLAGSSDVVAQKVAGGKKLQLRRFSLIVLYGFFYAGPFGHFLHKLLDYIFGGRRDSTIVAKKVTLEQLITGPWNNFLFMAYFGLIVEGRPWSLVKNKIRKDYPSVILNAWKVWPIISWVNYTYMPIHLRVLFHSLVAACWGVFLNMKARSLPIKAA
eukprot:c23636_g1_i2 orf=471-1028(+)